MAVAAKEHGRWASAAGEQFHGIGDYGFLSDCHTGALVASDGTVEWLCLPRFDSPSVFGALLDRRAGAFRLGPTALRAPVARRYVPGSNVLETSWMTATGWMVVHDALVLAPRSDEDGEGVRARGLGAQDAQHMLLRTVECVHGTIEVEAVCEPAFDYATEEASWKLVDKDGFAADASGGGETLRLLGDIPLQLDGRLARGVRTLDTGERGFLCLTWREELSGPTDAAHAVRLVQGTVNIWRRWLERGAFPDHPWRWTLQRSALALKGLTYEPTGALVAALTTSLPETPGGERNWDYRYTWIRDASFTLWSLHVIGFDEEAREFMEFVSHLCHGRGPETQIMFGIGGETELTERTLDHLDGYVGSKPVRVGNAAYKQRQNDVYGALLDSIYIHTKTREGVPEEMRRIVLEQAEAAAGAWRAPDQGIWEARGEPKHYVSSKLMCWVALDRAARLAADQGRPELADHWSPEADAIRADVLEHGVSERGVFRQHYDTDALDASVLLVPLFRFLPSDDERVRATVLAIADELTEHGLVLRYHVDETEDGLTGKEGTFTICSFWLVSALSEIGEPKRARKLCEQVLTHSTPLGLFGEEIEAMSGAQLGNYPQAFTHLALINAVSHVIADEQMGAREESSGVFTELRSAGAAG
ncbi:MAG: glycoside hydrolase family 15 protein [Solirubrobacterales bacterium]